jgi:hypothetical protein
MISRALTFTLLCLLVSSSAIAEQLLANVYPIKDVTGLVVGGGATVQIIQSDTESLRAIARQDVLDRVTVDLSRGRLKLGVESSNGGFFKWLNSSHESVKFIVQVKNLSSIQLNGGVYAEAGDFTADDLDIDLSGSGQLKMGKVRAQQFKLDSSGAGRLSLAELTGGSLDVELSGASFMEVKGVGSVQKLKVDASGASKYFATQVAAENAVAGASGASHIELRATKTLEANASGASHIQYFGNPHTQIQSSGASNIQSKGE